MRILSSGKRSLTYRVINMVIEHNGVIFWSPQKSQLPNKLQDWPG